MSCLSDDESPAKLKPQGPVKTRKVSTAVYRGNDGMPLQSKTIANIEMFQDKKTGYIGKNQLIVYFHSVEIS